MEVWVTNSYYQYFCGETQFQHRPSVDPTSMIKWRHRLGEEGMEWLLTAVVESAVKSGVVDRSSFAHISVDSTVIEKNILHPTDSALLKKLRGKLVAFMQEHELTIRQTYSRQGLRTRNRLVVMFTPSNSNVCGAYCENYVHGWDDYSESWNASLSSYR